MRTSRLVTLSLILAIAAAACGDDKKDDAKPGAAGTTSAAASAAPTSAAPTSAAPTSAAPTSAAPASSAPAASAKEVTLLWSLPDLQQPFFVHMQKSLREEAEKIGGITLIETDGQNKAEKQTADV
ncbi:MAG: hypothetical protein ABIM89_18560, partial [Mycobacteriales bacterium]